MKRFIFVVFLIALLIAAFLYKQETTSAKQAETEKKPTVETLSQSFEVLPIDEEIEKRVSGVSWKQGSPVSLDSLSYVRVIYWGFDDKQHEGELIVHASVAQEVAEIFKELYEKKFPIEKIRLIDEYAADDSKSMEDNNTSGFCYREVGGKPGKISKHSYGLAIDINPVQNPYIYKDQIVPTSGKIYTDRTDVKKGMIQKDDECYTAFTSRGWQWGGDWKYEKDYQHFQKNIEINE
ncbi:MAG: M15 family metallopeptidase [Lutisporaceae bacterium]